MNLWEQSMKEFAQPSHFSSYPEIGQAAVRRSAALLLAGVAIGAGLAMLLTPRRGSEIRAAIARSYRRTWEEVTGQARDLRDRARATRESGPNLIRFRQRARNPGT